MGAFLPEHNCAGLGAGVIKFWGPRENGAPRGPRILTFWGPHCDFGAPFELVQYNGVAGRKVGYIRMSGPVKISSSIKYRRVEQ